MRVLILVACALAIGMAPAASVHPSVDVTVGAILGGTVNGKWTSDEKIAPYVTGGERYRLYSLTKYLGEGIGGKPTEEPPGPSPSLDVKPLPETEKQIKAVFGPDWQLSFLHEALTGAGRVLAIRGDWNALPRIPSKQNTNQKAYLDAVASILKKHGIANPKVHINQLLRVDLEGDGQQEVIISATTTRPGYTEFAPKDGSRASKGDYSVVLVRRLVKGKLETIILDQDIYPKTNAEAVPMVYTIAGVLDFNGDGIMEIAVGWRYYEGNGTAVYSIKGNKATAVIEGGIGA